MEFGRGCRAVLSLVQNLFWCLVMLIVLQCLYKANLVMMLPYRVLVPTVITVLVGIGWNPGLVWFSSKNLFGCLGKDSNQHRKQTQTYTQQHGGCNNSATAGHTVTQIPTLRPRSAARDSIQERNQSRPRPGIS